MDRACATQRRPMGQGSRRGGDPASGDRQRADLLEAVRLRRDRLAFTDLFHHYAPRLKSLYVGRGASAAVAEELAQEAMLTVWRRAELYDRRRANVSAWIYTIARNKHTDLIRRQVLDDDLHEEWQEAPDDHPSVEASLHLEQSRHILHQALQGLRGEQEQVIRKAFSEAKSHQEIAVELGLPLGTVKSRIRLALGHLRATLPLAELR